MSEASLYDRLGGAFAIAAVVDHFSDAIVHNPIVGQRSSNPALREWHTNNLGRLPGLKFMRTLWVCNVSGGPFVYTGTNPGSTADLAGGVRRGRRRAWPDSRPRRGAGSREERGPGGIRRTQGRGDRGLHGGGVGQASSPASSSADRSTAASTTVRTDTDRRSPAGRSSGQTKTRALPW